MENLSFFYKHLLSLFTLHQLFLVSVGTVLGLLVGAAPGLTATMACALLLGVTYGLNAMDALLVLMAVFVGSMGGGSISAILLNVPGTPAAAATAVDGYILARNGKGAETIRVSAVSSCIGTILGAFSLLLLTPPLISVALNFASWEYTLFAIFGVMMCGSVGSGGDIPLKGWISGFVGLLLSTVGSDFIWNYPRFCYGINELQSGLPLVPVLIGLFGVGEIFDVMGKKEKLIIAKENDSELKGPKIVVPEFNVILYLRHWILILKSAVVGIIIGIVPGIGGEVATWAAYRAAMWGSKRKELFGKGNYEGVIASETANNASCGGVMIPALALAIPGSAVAAVILAGLWLHGIRPGPLLETEYPGFSARMAAMIFLCAFFMLVWMLLLNKPLSKVLLLPKEMVMASVAVLCVIGSYSMEMKMLDVYIMFCFGILGYVLRVIRYPLAPMIIGIVLGPMVDESLRKSFMLEKSILPFLSRPVSLIFIIVILLLVIIPLLKQWGRKEVI